VLVNLDPSEGSEQNKTRPAIVVSNNGANAAAARTGRGVITVVPCTTSVNRTGKRRPYQTEIEPGESGLPELSTAQAEQVRFVSITRVKKALGMLPPAAMSRVESALRVHLSL
jgi:mRNA interferase MazF